MSRQTLDLLGSGRRCYLRTSRHPSAAGIEAESFDDVYERADTFEAVYAEICDRLVAAAGSGEIVYAVPGSPVVAERTVEMLWERDEVTTLVYPALSFMDLAWQVLGIDPLAESVRLVDGQSFSLKAASERGPLLVAQCWSPSILSEIKLAIEHPPAVPVVLLHHLGLPDQAVVEVDWSELDRTIKPDHLTSLWIPQLAAPVGVEMASLVALAAELREKCAWDADQTHASLARHLREEAYETLDAIAGLGEDGEGADHLAEELGDLLYQVVFHCELGSEQGWFNLADVAKGIHDKLVARHPHVFGDGPGPQPDAETVLRSWEESKRVEKGRDSVLEGIPNSLPALAYAQQLQRRARPLAPQAEPSALVGDVLFQIVSLAGALGLDAEDALREAARAQRDVWAAKEAGRTSTGPGTQAGGGVIGSP